MDHSKVTSAWERVKRLEPRPKLSRLEKRKGDRLIVWEKSGGKPRISREGKRHLLEK